MLCQSAGRPTVTTVGNRPQGLPMRLATSRGLDYQTRFAHGIQP